MKRLFTVLWNIRQLDIWSPILAIIWMSFWDLIIAIPFKRYHCPKLGKYRWSYYRWYLIYGDELAQWRSSVFVLRAVPAAVVRFGRCRGSVVAVWGLLGDADPEEKDCEPPTTKPPYGGESGGNAAAVAAASKPNQNKEVITCITTVKNESTNSFAIGQMPAAKGQTPDKQTGKHGRLTCRSKNGFSMQKGSRTGAASSLIVAMISIWSTKWNVSGTAWNSSVRRCSGSITLCLTSRA